MSDIPAPPDNQTTPAQPAKPKLNKQQKKDIMWLVAFVATCGMILLLTVILLMRVLRRRLREMEARRKKDEMPDIWKAGGQRLTEQMSRDAGKSVDPFDDPDDGGPDDAQDKDKDENEDGEKP